MKFRTIHEGIEDGLSVLQLAHSPTSSLIPGGNDAKWLVCARELED